MSDSDAHKFEVIAVDGKFQVRDWTDRVVLTCGDVGSARQYAVLLTEAYRRGFKDGYRAGKSSGG